MKTRDLAGADNFVMHVNICIKMCVLMVNCIPNHTKCVEISPDFVIACM